VGKDEIIPAVERDEAVGSSEVDARLPFILADLIADAEGGLRVSDAHGSLLLAEVCTGGLIAIRSADVLTWD
jgi:hypothetical protein